MNPIVNFIENDDDSLIRFSLSGANVSIANGLRRTILSDIPVVVFRTTPHEKSKANIQINTGRLNNEILKQRLSCVPIHISDITFPYEKYQLDIDKKNETDVMQYVTTKDFKIKEIATGEYLSEQKTREIFPPDIITGDYILFSRLRPRISDEVNGEHLKLTCNFDVGTAGEDSAFNVVSACAYANTPDTEMQKAKWAEMEMELRNKPDMKISDEEIEFEKKNWYLLDAKRITVSDSFDFIVKTLGPLSNKSIVYRACDIIIQKIIKFKNDLKNEQEKMIETSSTTISHCYDIFIHNEGYTLGKIIEYILFSSYYEKTDILTYCGFQKPHPHIDICKIRIAFKEAVTDKSIVASYLNNAADAVIKVYERIALSFKD